MWDFPKISSVHFDCGNSGLMGNCFGVEPDATTANDLVNMPPFIVKVLFSTFLHRKKEGNSSYKPQ